MPATTPTARIRTLVVVLSVALLALGVTPTARATTTYDSLWVAPAASSSSAPGTSCAHPGFVGTTESALADAVAVANDGATIHVCPGLYNFGSPVGSDLGNLSVIGTDLTTTFFVGGRTTAFLLTEGNLTVAGITFFGGYSGDSEGGAVAAGGVLTINSARFNSNYSEKGGGAVAGGIAVNVDSSSFTNNSTHDQGGAIASFGTVTVTNSVFTSNESIADNECVGGGGAIAAADDVHVTGSRFEYNSASLTVRGFCNNDPYGEKYGGKGGAIATKGYVWATNSTFTKNHAEMAGGAIAELDPVTPTVVTDVGGEYVNDTFTGNDAALLGGGALLVHDKTTIKKSRFVANRAGVIGGGAIFSDTSHGILNISGSRFSKNVVFTPGGCDGGPCDGGAVVGGIVNVTGSNFDRNTGATFGGAIAASAVRATYSSFTKNSATLSGGAIMAVAIVIKHSAFTGNTLANTLYPGRNAHGGGAIFVCGTLDVDYSTFTRNQATTTDAASSFSGVGGAIAGYGDSATISHSGFINNVASARGGAVSFGEDGSSMSVTLVRNRFLSNRAGGYGGAVELGTSSAATYTASVYNTFIGNRAGLGGAVLAVVTTGAVTQADLNRFAAKNTRRGNRGPGAGILLIVVPG